MHRPVKYEALEIKTRKIPRVMNGGLNNGLDVFSIAEEEFSEGLNISSRNYPAVSPRLSRGEALPVLTNSPWHIGKRADEFMTVVDGLKWNYYNSGWIELATLTTEHRAASADLQGVTMLVNGTDRKAWDGATVTDITDMPLVDLIDVYGNRVFAASTDDDSLHYSAIATYDDWTTANDAGVISVATRDNAPCTGLVAYNGHIVYFKKTSIHELYGTKPTDFYMISLTEGNGCVDPRSIIEIDGVLYFMGADGIYYYTGGAAPEKLSYPKLDGFIKDIDLSREVIAGSDGRSLYMSIPYGTTDRALITFNTDIGIFLPEDDLDVVEFTYFQDRLYGLGSDKQIVSFREEDGTEVVSWNFITKAFDENLLSSIKSVYKVYLAASVPEDSSITISISPDATGDTFTEIGTITGDGLTIGKTQFFIPTDFTNCMDWSRIKVSGIGDATLHKMELNVRIRPDNF